MASFTVRIELRGMPSRSDYQSLHAAMVANGFRQTVEINGNMYHLPHAEYDFTRDMSAHQVTELVKPIVAPIWQNYLLLVTGASERAGFLVPVT